MAITWRSVANPIANDQAEFFRQGTQAIQGGISGLGNLAKGISRDMDAEQLNDVLNQIEGLNTFGSARQAQQDNLVESLNLRDPAMERQARNALQSQVDTNLVRNDQAIARDDKFTLDAVEKAVAEGQFDLARDVAGDLTFGSGRATKAVKDAEKTQQQKAAEKQLTDSVISGFTNRYNTIEANNELSNQIKSAMTPAQQEVFIVDDTTGRLMLNPRVSESEAAEYAGVVNEIDQFNWQNVPTREQVRAQALGNLSPILGLDKTSALLQGADEVLSRDVIANREQMRDEAAVQSQIAEAEAQLGYTIEDNPYKPRVAIEDEKTIGEIALGYLESAMGNQAWSDVFKGDFPRFTKTLYAAVKNAGGSDVSPAAISTALANDPQVLEAAAEGNLGDWLDNLNLEEFTDSLKSIDTDFKTINEERRFKVRQKEADLRNMNARFGQARANR